MLTETIRAAFPDAEKSGKGWQARCPVCGKVPLFINNTGGRTHFHCLNGGCKNAEICKAVGLTPPETVLDAALAYRKRGFAPIPIPHGKKGPTRKGWQNLRLTEGELPKLFNGAGNIGLLLGEASGGLIDVDLDCPEAIALADRYLPETSAKTGRPSAVGSHRWYRVTEKISPIKFSGPNNETLVELRSDGQQTVVGPSIHPSGELYTVLDGEPASVEAGTLIGAVRALAHACGWQEKEPHSESASAQPKASRVPPSNKLKRRARAYLSKIPGAVAGQNGSCPTYAAAVALVHGFGMPEPTALELLREYNQRCQPQWSVGELEHKIHDAATKPHDKPRGWLLGDNGDGTEKRRKPKEDGSLEDTEDDEQEDGVPCTDLGNSERMVAHCGNKLRHCNAWGKWLVWDDKRWKKDDTGVVVRLAKETVRKILEEVELDEWANTSEGRRYIGSLIACAQDAEADTDFVGARAKEVVKEIIEESSRGGVIKWAKDSESRKNIDAMIALARSDPKFAVSADALDADPWLLNVQNGSIDLRNGALRDHAQADLITKIANASYDPAAICPEFDKFMERIFRGHPAIIEYLKLAFGYGCTGSTREQVLFFLYGKGANGKTVLVDAILHVLGDYAGKADPELLIARDNSAHPTNVADLMGRRLVVCSETNEGRRFNEARMKDLVGETKLKARFMRQDFFEFTATHKMIIYSNHRPGVRATDHGFWRRMRLIPFVETIPDAEQDKRLPEKLKSEADGILRWLVEGAIAWHRDGLGTAPEVQKATAEYRSAEDTIASFLDERCERGEGFKEGASELFEDYKEWAEKNRERVISQKRFGTQLGEHGLSKGDHPTTRRGVWYGIRLKNPIWINHEAAGIPNASKGSE